MERYPCKQSDWSLEDLFDELKAVEPASGPLP